MTQWNRKTTLELTLCLGSPDLYDVGTRSSGKKGGIALFDVMANPFGPRNDGIPGSLSAFTKHQIDWISPTVIDSDGEYTIRSSNVYADYFQIKEGFPDGEYLLIENRAAVDYDEGMPGAGIVIYHVDLAVPFQDRPGFPGQPGWPQNGNHYRVAILPADGQYDLEQNVNNGDLGDFWTKDQVLGPSNGQKVFPNTDSYQSGIVRSTEIRIKISSDPGLEMSIEVTGLGRSFMAQPMPTPVPVATSASVLFAAPSIQPMDNRGSSFHWNDKDISGSDTNDPDQPDGAVGKFDFFMSTDLEHSPSPSPSPMNLGNSLGYASLRTEEPVHYATILGHATLDDTTDPGITPPTDNQEYGVGASGTFVFGNDKDSKDGISRDTSHSYSIGSTASVRIATTVTLLVWTVAFLG